ncbi:hypothetical protein [Paracoccus sp. (in: a-proteobacteria)]|uniref:hypothetical protein n=1 Tax=Paracoccus sp. TaxID=267 RepID=UPI00321FE9C1
MNEISDDELKEVKRLAGLFFVPQEIALMLEKETSFFCEECFKPLSKLYNAFQGGRLQGEVDLRTGILKMAKAGSSPAQTMALDLLDHSKILLMDGK